MKKDVKTNLLSHSEAKVRLLSEYLKRYLNIICNNRYTKRIKIYDLFCGEGLYENGGEGSPLVMLRAIKDIHFINAAKLNKIPPIDCHFNDIDALKVENVKKAVAKKSLYYKDFGEIEFTNNDYQKEVEELLKVLPRMKDEKAFIFIDPYEYKHIKASQIKNLMVNGNAEVLLWLPTQFMYRFSEKGTPVALKDFIEELIQFKDWNKSKSVWHFISQLKEGFQAFLGSQYFVDKFTIQKDENTVFCLFFFTSHIYGFEKMLEAKWDIDTEYGEGWNYSGNIPSLFHEQKINPLEDKLMNFIKAQERSNGEIYEFTVRNGYIPKFTNEIFYNWQNNGKLEVKASNNEKIRKGSFYISYQNFRDNSQKVFFKIK